MSTANNIILDITDTRCIVAPSNTASCCTKRFAKIENYVALQRSCWVTLLYLQQSYSLNISHNRERNQFT